MGSVFAQAHVLEVIQVNIVAAAIILLLLYLAIGFGPLRRLYQRPGRVTGKQIVAFSFGCVVLYLSFGGPLDYLSDHYLFSVHMLQHMLEILLMTPLLLIGTPTWMVAGLLKMRFLAKLFSYWRHPIVSSVVFNVVLNGFHIPAIYDYALTHDAFHLFEHLVFFVISIFLWLAFFRLSQGKQLLYLLLNYNLMMPLVIFMVIASHPWYTYYVSQPRIWAWLTPLADQQLGGIIMAVTMMGVYAGLGIRAYAKQDESLWYN